MATEPNQTATAERLPLLHWRVLRGRVDIYELCDATGEILFTAKSEKVANRIIASVSESRRREAAWQGVVDALRPFAEFGRQWKRQPIGRIADEFYGIHSGTEYEAMLKVSDCMKALDAYDAATEGVKG